MEQYKAYTYLLKFKPTGKVYYGVRFKNIRLKQHPSDDFMVKYKTSSNLIKQLIKEHGIDKFEWEIRKTFDTKEQAVKWEQTVLRRCNVLNNQQKWYNANVSGYKITTSVGRKKISDTHKGVAKTAEHKAKISAKLKGVKKTYVQTEEHRRKNSEANRGENHPRFGLKWSKEERRKCGEKNRGRPAHNKGQPMTQEQKDKIKEVKEANKKVCEHCGKTFFQSLYKRWHGDICRKRNE